MENRFSCSNISCTDIERHGIVSESFGVKRIQFLRKLMVTKLNTVQIPCLQKRSYAAVARILTVVLVISKRPANLPGFKVAAKHGAGRYSGCAVKFDSLFHKDIDHAAGEQSPHGAAFHHQSGLHCRLIPFLIHSSSVSTCPPGAAAYHRSNESEK